MWKHCDYVTWSLAFRVTDEIHCIFGDASLPLAIGEHDCKDRVPHAGIPHGHKSRSLIEQAIASGYFNFQYILDPYELLVSVVLRIYTPKSEVRNLGFDVDSVENFAVV